MPSVRLPSVFPLCQHKSIPEESYKGSKKYFFTRRLSLYRLETFIHSHAIFTPRSFSSKILAEILVSPSSTIACSVVIEPFSFMKSKTLCCVFENFFIGCVVSSPFAQALLALLSVLCP